MMVDKNIYLIKLSNLMMFSYFAASLNIESFINVLSPAYLLFTNHADWSVFQLKVYLRHSPQILCSKLCTRPHSAILKPYKLNY